MTNKIEACEHGWPAAWRSTCTQCLAELSILLELREKASEELDESMVPYSDDDEVGPEVIAAYMCWVASDRLVQDWYLEAGQG